MNARMIHRGPDGAEEHRDGESSHIFLAMRRLSIIDLEHGWQPLYNEDKTLAQVANGEIYNFVELRAALERQGHRFSTGSDCETILHLYEQYGLNFVDHLRGMFAFALWDVRKRRLIIGRDRMGEKLLYLYEKDGTLLFASEMKVLLASGQVPFELDPVAVNDYLHYGFVPEPRSMVQGVRKLKQGHLLIIDLDPWEVKEQRYWSFLDAPPVEGNPSELIRAELETIARLIVRSDVPVGVALSGGLDSSLIAELAQKTHPGTMQAFSVGYSGRPSQDERQMAKEFADHLGMPFHEVEIAEGEMVEFFPELNYWRDDPIADIAGYGYYVLNRAAREQGCPVLIQGQGGDELFWGYPWMVRAVEETMRKANGERGNLLKAFLAHLLQGMSKVHMLPALYLFGGVFYGWKKLRSENASPSDQIAFYDLCDTYQIGAYAARKTYTPSFAGKLGDHSASHFFRIPEPWPRSDLLVMRLLCESYLLQNGLVQGDRLCMANSVELRLPLLDYRLTELVVGLQKSQPNYHLPYKAWLKDAVKGVVPDWLLNRPKRGFNPPVTP